MDYSRAVRAPRGAVIAEETSVDRTVSIEAESDAKVLDILQALLLKVGANTLAGVQPRGRGSYDVAFHTVAAYRDALAWDLAQDESCLKKVSPSNGLTRVRILSTPMYWKWGPLLDVLATYGEVSHHFYETFQGYPTIRNGTRVVLIKLNGTKSLSDTIQVENIAVRLDYPGVQKSCFYCRKPGHMVRDCPKKAQLVETPDPPMEASDLLVETLLPMETVVAPEASADLGGPSGVRGLKRKEAEERTLIPDEPYMSAGEGDSVMDFDALVIVEAASVPVPACESWSTQVDKELPLASSDAGSLVTDPPPGTASSSPQARPESRRIRQKEVKALKSARLSSPSVSPGGRSSRSRSRK